MSVWGSLRGHAAQREMFQRAIQRGRLSQAYLFVGSEGIGKYQFARRLAQYLLCRKPDEQSLEPCGDCTGCKPYLAGSHPDFLYVGCPEGKREIPISALVGSEERRGQEGLCHDLSLAALRGSRKVAIINDADTMNEASANAFLKTLEEPPDRAVLMLIASNLDALLPTIRSRCQLVRFSPLNQDDVEALLIEQRLVESTEEARFAAALSEGSLTVAQQLLEPELKALRALLYTALAQPGFSGFGLSKQLYDGLSKISGEVAEQRRLAKWLLQFTVEFYRAALHDPDSASSKAMAIPEAEKLARRIADQPDGIELLATLIERTVDASSQIDMNVGVALALDSLYDDLSRANRPPVTRG